MRKMPGRCIWQLNRNSHITVLPVNGTAFKNRSKKQAEKDQEKSDENRTVEEAVFPLDQENAVQLNGRIYTLRLDKNASDADQEK